MIGFGLDLKSERQKASQEEGEEGDLRRSRALVLVVA
jgi:hypothetical protein